MTKTEEEIKSTDIRNYTEILFYKTYFFNWHQIVTGWNNIISCPGLFVLVFLDKKTSLEIKFGIELSNKTNNIYITIPATPLTDLSVMRTRAGFFIYSCLCWCFNVVVCWTKWGTLCVNSDLSESHSFFLGITNKTSGFPIKTYYKNISKRPRPTNRLRSL